MTHIGRRIVPPRPVAMIESLRGLGYSTASALADIVDNSISADAKTVEIEFHWEGSRSHITILDDGRGMDEPELEKAMRLGSLSPLNPRASSDLGRFGLGLKTASFSQGRVLTVASRKNWDLACLRWDLDFLVKSPDEDWHLLEGPSSESKYLLDVLAPRASGTLVIWEKLDRIVTGGFSETDFLNLIDEVEQNLAMIFGRYLNDQKQPLRLLINGRSVRGWDPFLQTHPATYPTQAATLETTGGKVILQGFVLPHRSRLNSEEFEQAGGPSGWVAQQGFYVYRQRRLLVPGSWLGLGKVRSWTRDEAHQLARIRLDITNSADEQWKIDVRKSTARPPAGLRPQLIRFGEHVRQRARRVLAHRGQAISRDGVAEFRSLWVTGHTSSAVRYRIDPDHPAVAAVLAHSKDLEPAVKALIRLIEETVPVQRIWLDTAEGKDNTRPELTSDNTDQVSDVLHCLFRQLTERCGFDEEDAKRRLLASEPFHNFPTLVARLGSKEGPHV